MKLENPRLTWEAFKYLSRNELSDKELDVYYFLIHHYIKEDFNVLFTLLERAQEEKITASQVDIKNQIELINLNLETFCKKC